MGCSRPASRLERRRLYRLDEIPFAKLPPVPQTEWLPRAPPQPSPPPSAPACVDNVAQLMPAHAWRRVQRWIDHALADLVRMHTLAEAGGGLEKHVVWRRHRRARSRVGAPRDECVLAPQRRAPNSDTWHPFASDHPLVACGALVHRGELLTNTGEVGIQRYSRYSDELIVYSKDAVSIQTLWCVFRRHTLYSGNTLAILCHNTHCFPNQYVLCRTVVYSWY